jgi:hypothetical protein
MSRPEQRERDGERRNGSRRKVDKVETFAERTIWNPQFLFGAIGFLLLISLLTQVVMARGDSGRETAARERSRAQLTQLTAIAHTNSETLTRLKDCTEPGGKCSTRNQEATQAAIQSLVRTSVAAGMCSAITRTEIDYNECIKNQLGAQIGD